MLGIAAELLAGRAALLCAMFSCSGRLAFSVSGDRQWTSFPRPLSTCFYGLLLKNTRLSNSSRPQQRIPSHEKPYYRPCNGLPKLRLITCPAVKCTSYKYMQCMNPINILCWDVHSTLKKNDLFIVFTLVFLVTRAYECKEEKREGEMEKNKKSKF